MKKFILISFLICMISGCSNAASTHIIKDKSKESIHEISYNQVQEKINNEEDFVLYIGRNTCKDCMDFKPVLHDYLDQHAGVYLYYLDTTSIKEDKELYNKIKEELDFSWVPTLKLISKGKIEDSYSYLDEEYYSLKSDEQKQEKQKYITQFTKWMDNIYVEE